MRCSQNGIRNENQPPGRRQEPRRQGECGVNKGDRAYVPKNPRQSEKPRCRREDGCRNGATWQSTTLQHDLSKLFR